MAIELQTVGGTLDPSGRRPPIGGSMTLIIDTKRKHAVVIDSGAYHPSEEDRRKHSEIILEKEEEGTRRYEAGEIIGIPNLGDVFGDLDTEISEVTENNFPDFSILEEMEKITIVITHAHFDHIGSLVYVKKQFPHARVYMTRPTLEMAVVNWTDSLKITREQGLIPAYSSFDIHDLEQDVHIITEDSVISDYPFSLSFTPSGHILGAIGVVIKIEDKPGAPTFYVTGDVSMTAQYSVGAGQLPTSPIDYLICESTNAGQKQRERAAVEEQLIAVVREHLSNGGRVLFPVLSIGRPIELMMLFVKHGVLSEFDVRIDGLAQVYAKIYQENGCTIPSIEKHFITGNAQRELYAETTRPHVMLASGAMLYEKSRAAFYAPYYARSRKNAIIMSSYIDPCSPSFKLLRAPTGSRFRLGRRFLNIHADVYQLGLSAHASHEELCGIHRTLNPHASFCVHGHESGINALIYDLGDSVRKTYLDTTFRF